MLIMYKIVILFIYGILDTNKEGLKYNLPSVKFEKPYLNIDNIKFENPIDNDISAYDELKINQIIMIIF